MIRSNWHIQSYAIIVVLVLTAAAAATYAGRLRWQNAFLRAELSRAREQVSTRSNAPAPAPAPVLSAERNLGPEQRAAMLEKLNGETGTQKDVWFTFAANDREAATYQRALQAVFEEAGWRVRSSEPVGFALRPGIFFMMADSSPPPYVSSALAAFQAAGIGISSGRDYRAFNERKKREDPSWRGFEMDGDQHYIVAVGPAAKD